MSKTEGRKRFSLGGMIKFGIVLMFAFVGFSFAGQIFEKNDAGFMQIKQAAVSGKLTCRMEPGMYGQFFGDIHTYSEAETFYFTADDETGAGRNQSLPARFNDGAKAQVSGSLRVILPSDCETLISIHRKFHSMNGVMKKLVLPAVRKALFSTGPHMSAGESYAERRGEFGALAEDQLQFGVIKVDKRSEMRPDPITGESKEVFTLIKRGCVNEGPTCVGGFERDPSAFKEFGIGITNFVIDGIQYPEAVLQQIEAQRSARMNIITQQATAKEAEARAAKAGAEAIAQVAETRAAAEVEKTKIIVAAEAARESARLDAEAAELERKANIARGEGEAKRRELEMRADGALDKKLAAMVQIHKAWADAYSRRPVPQMVMGGGGQGDTDSGTVDFSQAMQLLVAKELGLDLSISAAASR